MTQLDDLSRRLTLAEQEIGKARARTAVSSCFSAIAAATTMVALWGSPSVRALAPTPLTVRAPFVVVDAQDKPIITVKDGTAVVMKDIKTGKETSSAASNRGLDVLNAAGDVVARQAVDSQGHGYLLARKAGAGQGFGGVAALLMATDKGTELVLAHTDEKPRVNLTSGDRGLVLRNESGSIVAELNSSELALNDAGGNPILKAGMLPDGRGVINMGPRLGGPMGPGQLGFPYRLVGRK
jgi:hypothetical protein